MRLAALATASLPLFLAACASTVVVSEPASAPGPELFGPVASLKIPPGHYPPPGMCRVWYPGRPPGRQPRAGSCASVARNVTPGAWVLHRPTSAEKVIEVTAYHEARPAVIAWVRYYDAKTGAFLWTGRTD